MSSLTVVGLRGGAAFPSLPGLPSYRHTWRRRGAESEHRLRLAGGGGGEGALERGGGRGGGGRGRRRPRGGHRRGLRDVGEGLPARGAGGRDQHLVGGFPEVRGGEGDPEVRERRGQR